MNSDSFSSRSKPARVLVCGGRDYDDKETIYDVLDALHTDIGIICIISGAARGADTLAINWAEDRAIPLHKYPANWDKYGKQAGALRNQQMLDEGKPDMVIAFPGGKGTADMVMRTTALHEVVLLELSEPKKAEGFFK